MRKSPIQRFFTFIDCPGQDCWEWHGARSGANRYGSFKLKGAMVSAHCAAWLLLRGPIPDGLWVLHNCDNKPCVNPDHLYLGTPEDNARDRTMRSSYVDPRRHQESCKYGHPLSGENLYISPTQGNRHCRTCTQRRRMEYELRKAEQRRNRVRNTNNQTQTKTPVPFTYPNTKRVKA